MQTKIISRNENKIQIQRPKHTRIHIRKCTYPARIQSTLKDSVVIITWVSYRSHINSWHFKHIKVILRCTFRRRHLLLTACNESFSNETHVLNFSKTVSIIYFQRWICELFQKKEGLQFLQVKNGNWTMRISFSSFGYRHWMNPWSF